MLHWRYNCYLHETNNLPSFWLVQPSWTGFGTSIQGCWICAIVLFSQRYNCICACGELVYSAEYQVALVPCWTTREKENGGSEAGGLFPETRTPNYILWQWGGKGQCILRRYNRNRSKVSPGHRRWFFPNVYKHETGLLRLRWELTSHALAVSLWKASSLTICQLFVINLLLCVCVFVCLFVCLYVCYYVCLHVCLSVQYVWLFLCLFVCIYIYICMYVHVCVYVYVCACAYVFVMCLCASTCMCICVHVCVCVCVCV